MKINQVAKLTGITVRTLHYYDEIGLLKPHKITDSGYRLYDSADLELLQQILFFKELDFSLDDIKKIITSPQYDRESALKNHKALLIKKKNRIENLISLVDNTLKGAHDMSFKQFDMSEIEACKKNYEKEVKDRWGNTQAFKESQEKTKDYSSEQWKMMSDEGSLILKEFGENRHIDPSGEKALALVKKWQDYISSSFYNCTNEILSCLGLMYIQDERFTKNIDKNGEGTALFMSQAIKAFCEK